MWNKEVQSKIDNYTYEEILKKIPKLAEKDPIAATKLLADKLNKAIFLEQKKNSNKASDDDYSYYWRPAIEEHSNNWETQNIKSMLVKSLRDVLETSGYKNIETLKKILEILKEKNYHIFRRLELHVYRLFPNEFKNEIEIIAVDYFGKASFLHEYYLLLQQNYATLTKFTQEKILALIEQGPNFDRFRGTKEEFEQYKKYWKASKLEPIIKYLPIEKQQEYDNLVHEVGPLELTNFSMSQSAFQQIVSHTELSEEMNVDQVIAFIKSYRLKDEHFMEDDGTATKFKEFVEKMPLEYSSMALELLSAHPVFSYELFWGLSDALKNKKKIEWVPVITLCEKILENSQDSRYEKTLGNIISFMADLLETNMLHTDLSIGFEMRDRVWQILKKLVELAADDSTWASSYPKRNFDSFTISINSEIGRSMNAVMQYSVWCYHGLKKKTHDKDGLVNEVKKLLSERLDPKIDSTVSTHAVFGFHLANLFALDKEWTRENLKKIFLTGELEILGYAAWDAYLHQQIYSNVFVEMKEEYANQINKLNSKEPEEEIKKHVEKRLAEQIGLTYMLKIKESEPLFNLFMSKAPPRLMGYCIEFIGRQLEYYKKDGKTPEQDIKQLCNKKEIQKYPEAGWLFLNSVLDKNFNIHLLLETLNQTHGKIEPIYQIPKELVSYAKDFPIEVLQCMEKIIQAYQKTFEIPMMKDHLREIIKIVKDSSDSTGISKAAELVNFLGSLGYEEY
ncbi:MAG: hypothetical protein WBE60_06090, partial [Nitrosotalea sp.]